MKSIKKEFDIVGINVNKILNENIRARNDDKFLIFKYWTEVNMVKQITEDSISKLTSPESIRRMRQKIQSTGKFLPTSPEVLTQRRIREQEIRAYFGGQSQTYLAWQKRRFGIK